MNSIKYICKYVNKGRDIAVFQVENTPVNNNDEITLYQIGRYVSSNEAGWRIFGFPIHERDPAVFHLAVHLENSQRVYFSSGKTAIYRAINVACSQVGKPSSLFVLAKNGITKNIVHSIALRD